MHRIDSAEFTNGILRVSGWCFKEGASVVRVDYSSGGGMKSCLTGYGKNSEDIAAIYGAEFGRARFEFNLTTSEPSGLLIFHFSDASRLEERIDPCGDRTGIRPLRHQIHEGRYRGVFRVAKTESVSEVYLVQVDGSPARGLVESDYSVRQDGEDLVLEIALQAEAEWRPESVGLRLCDDRGRLREASNVEMLALSSDPAHRISGTFIEWMRAHPGPLRVLEIGSRARSGVVRRRQFGLQHEYVGLDFLDGENVDIVCDVHELSRQLEPGSFDVVVGYSVFEHIAMPWKAGIEINRILKAGGQAMFFTHQTWPLHDVPFDFWRFSADTWRTLFNRSTGFQVLEAACGEPARIVPEVQKSGRADLGNALGYLCSAVRIKKVDETRLDWEVPTEDVYTGGYPG
jgi:SAM-dependent methyltransferase